jgi:hypothetical protein
MRKNLTQSNRHFVATIVMLICISVFQVAKSAILNNGKNKQQPIAATLLPLSLKQGFSFIGGAHKPITASKHDTQTLVYQKGNTIYVIPYNR